MEGPNIRATLIDDLVHANHVLVDHGILDAFGHVSVRAANTVDRFLLARNMAPALVTKDDILEFDFEANAIGSTGIRVYLERFIHSEIYRRRSDISAIVHSHAPSIIPFTVARDVRLCPVCHMSGFITSSTPVFEIRNYCGDESDLLIRNRGLGAKLADVLGEEPLILMRGHGMTAVGSSIPQVVFRSIYAEVNARIQGEAMRLGALTYLTDAEARAADLANNGQIDRAWGVWKSQVGIGCSNG